VTCPFTPRPGLAGLDSTVATGGLAHLSKLKHFAFALLPIQVAVDLPPVALQGREEDRALVAPLGELAGLHSMPDVPVHTLRYVPVGPCEPTHVSSVPGGHETICEVSSAPENRLDVKAEPSVRKATDLAVDRELVIESEHV
jgi:hypothetical protein